jgi:uncharacterized membrane protein HdeD (DUF308 family)
MTFYDASSEPASGSASAPPVWVRISLGLILILAGLFILGDIALATFISAVLIGATAIAAGSFEIVHAIWTKGWGGLAWHVLLGFLYVSFGIVLVTEPLPGSPLLTYVLGLVLVLSGIVRILFAYTHWKETGRIMLSSGTFGVIAGLVILTGFSMNRFWLLGLLLSIDLISHGIAWLTYGRLPSQNRPAA